MVKDSNYASLHTPVEPLVPALDPQLIFEGAMDVGFGSAPTARLAVRIHPDDLPGMVALLERTWNRMAPDEPFDYEFLDEAVDGQYRREERFGQMVRIATVLAIFIACLGLFGLAALSAVRRTREVGIRKVMGASVISLVVLLSADLTRLVAVAFVVAVPVAYLVMGRWLEDFAFHLRLGPLTFVSAGVLALVVAWAAVGMQALKPARTDPVECLRYE